ncbi:MAG TPA: LPXTG cell wall anchor domain-containing protein [Pseudolysinimonas sp.]|nr:LPXTG cell wall anchor domain-containing protein [Pseudolysinimonas sp.]
MSCTTLAMTGGPAGMQLFVALALVLIGVGIVLVLRRRPPRASARQSRTGIVVALLLVAGGALVGISGPSEAAQAAGPCTLTITQTSTMSGLAPDRAPEAITGTVTNNGTDDTTIHAVVVSIASVTMAPEWAASTTPCVASDFTLLNPTMVMDVTLPPGGTATFGGASIGFRDGVTNQNSCKGSTVHLSYSTAS